MKREDVVRVNCTQSNPALNYDFEWKAIGKSKTVEKKVLSRFIQTLTIRGASISASQSKFDCSLEKRLPHEKIICCTVIAKIQHRISSTQATAITTLSATSQRQRSRIPSTTAASIISSQEAFNASTVSATLAFTTYPNGTSLPNVSSVAFNSFQTVTISATVSAIAVLLLGVGLGAAVVIIKLKRKRLSDGVTSNDSSDNLAYLLDVKQQQVWSGNEIIPIDCLLIGKSLGKPNFGHILEN